ncbi:MAG: hypothetical protein ACK56I_26500 [bacterium]
MVLSRLVELEQLPTRTTLEGPPPRQFQLAVCILFPGQEFLAATHFSFNLAETIGHQAP